MRAVVAGAVGVVALMLMGGQLCLTQRAIADTEYKIMTVEDFFLDRKDIVGQKVEIHADFQSGGDLVFIVLAGGQNATFISTDAVSRDHRKEILERCPDKCVGTVKGTVALFPGDIGIVADDIVLDP